MGSIITIPVATLEQIPPVHLQTTRISPCADLGRPAFIAYFGFERCEEHCCKLLNGRPGRMTMRHALPAGRMIRTPAIHPNAMRQRTEFDFEPFQLIAKCRTVHSGRRLNAIPEKHVRRVCASQITCDFIATNLPHVEASRGRQRTSARQLCRIEVGHRKRRAPQSCTGDLHPTKRPRPVSGWETMQDRNKMTRSWHNRSSRKLGGSN